MIIKLFILFWDFLKKTFTSMPSMSFWNNAGIIQLFIFIIVLTSYFKAPGQSAFNSFSTDIDDINNFDNYSLTYGPENFKIKNAEFDSLNIPLKRAGRLFLIEVKLDGQVGNFIFDTGASNLLLNRTYFRDYKTSGTQKSFGITGNVNAVDQVLIDSLEFSDLKYTKIQADVANLNHLENRAGVRILGLLGFNMIKNFEIILDGNNNLLQLFRIDRNGSRVNSKAILKTHCTQKIEFLNNILFLTGKISDRKLLFCFDTGAEMNSLSSYCPKKVLSSIAVKGRTILKGAGSGNYEVLHGIMGNFEFETYPIKGMETIIADLGHLSMVYGNYIDGILGYNFISQGIISINFVKRQFGITFIKQD